MDVQTASKQELLDALAAKFGPTKGKRYNPRQPRDPGGQHGGRWIKLPGGQGGVNPGDKNWLGEEIRPSGVRREGFPAAAEVALVTTGNPDMNRFASPAMGRLLTPDMQDSGVTTEEIGAPFAADNGGFWGVDEDSYKKMVKRLHDSGVHPLWITVPDVFLHPFTVRKGHRRKRTVWAPNKDDAAKKYEAESGHKPDSVELDKDTPPRGDADATIARFEQWQQYLENLGLPAAFVAQDGMDEPERFAWLEKNMDKIRAVFLGGSDDFKLGPGAHKIVKLARKHGKLVHMGRVSTEQRIAYGRDVLQVDTFDGSSLARFKDAHLPRSLAMASGGNPPPTRIGQEWIRAAIKARDSGSPWPRPPGRTSPQWPRGFFKSVTAVYTQDLADALYLVGLSDYVHLRYTPGEPGFSVKLTKAEEAGWLVDLLGLPTPEVEGMIASWPQVTVRPGDEDEWVAGNKGVVTVAPYTRADGTHVDGYSYRRGDGPTPPSNEGRTLGGMLPRPSDVLPEASPGTKKAMSEVYVGREESFAINAELRRRAAKLPTSHSPGFFDYPIGVLDREMRKAGSIGKQGAPNGVSVDRVGPEPNEVAGLSGVPSEWIGARFTEHGFGSTADDTSSILGDNTAFPEAGISAQWKLEVDPRVRAVWGANPEESELVLDRELVYEITNVRRPSQSEIDEEVTRMFGYDDELTEEVLGEMIRESMGWVIEAKVTPADA